MCLNAARVRGTLCPEYIAQDLMSADSEQSECYIKLSKEKPEDPENSYLRCCLLVPIMSGEKVNKNHI